MTTTERPEPTRTRTPAQQAAWAKVEEDRRLAGPTDRGVDAWIVARVVIGVLVVVAALTAWVAIPADRADDRRDALLLVGLLGGGVALAASAFSRSR